jgi:hypothetical protein
VANYPSIPQVVGSTQESSSGTTVDRAVSGKPRFRTYYPQTWHVFHIQHECYDTDYDTIISHYAAHQFIGFDFVFSGDGVTYAVRYAERPQAQPIEGDFRWKVQTILIST